MWIISPSIKESGIHICDTSLKMLQNYLLPITVQIVSYCFSYALSVQELIYRYYYGTFSGELFSLVQTFKTFTFKTRSAMHNRPILFFISFVFHIQERSSVGRASSQNTLSPLTDSRGNDKPIIFKSSLRCYLSYISS